MSKYGFYDRLTEDFPSQVCVDVTERCNLACKHCQHAEFEKSAIYTGTDLSPMLNSKLVHEVADWGRESCNFIRYTADGEPLLHPKLMEMLRYAQRHSKAAVTLTTNGTLLTQLKAQELAATEITAVDFSIDAFNEATYRSIRGQSLESVINNICYFLELWPRPKVVVSFIEQPDNLGEADFFERRWKLLGADYVVIRRMHSCAGVKEDIAEFMNREDKERRPCLYPWERIVLNARGYLQFCPAVWTGGADVINYNIPGTTIREAWNSQYYKDLRDAHLANTLDSEHPCAKCPDWQYTRWPDEGRSYADMMEEFNENT